jgi:hypothetical protein
MQVSFSLSLQCILCVFKDATHPMGWVTGEGKTYTHKYIHTRILRTYYVGVISLYNVVTKRAVCLQEKS